MTNDLRAQLQATLGDGYSLDRELGGGGMSHVYLAHERALGRRIVIKVLLPELVAGVSVERFRREIQLAAQLQHPHIVPLLTAGESQGLPFFTMPYVVGESLRARVARDGELPIAEAVRILRDVVSALAYAHGSGIMHRDIKPDNVLLTGGVAVVTDFGVAKAITAATSAAGHHSSSLTSMGIALGTPAYMAPEQASADPGVDHRADIYALGAMAYEMLTGLPPFSGRSAQATLAAHVVEAPDPVERRRPAVPPMLAALVMQCLAKRPADRPQSASDVLHVLDAIGTPSGGTAPTTAVSAVAAVPPAVGRSGLSRARLLLLAVAAGVLVAVAALRLRRTSPPTTAAATPVPAAALAAPPASVAVDSASATARRAPAPAHEPAPAVHAAVPKREPAARRRPPADAPKAAEPAPSAAAAAAPLPESIAALPAPHPVPVPQTPVSVVLPAPAPPLPPADPRPEVRGVLAEYGSAIESQSIANIRRVYPGMTAAQQQGWERFFQMVRGVKAELNVGQLDVSGGMAEAQVSGAYTFVNGSTHHTDQQPVSFHATLRQDAGVWRIMTIR